MALAAVMGIDPTAVADTPEFQLGQLGAIVDDTSGTRIYKYVQYDTGSGSVAAVSGNATSQTCLLYTSPSPRDGLLSRMPSSA